ncbi:MAG: MarR family winged helix-turn-helix transcriptional regulator [Aureispira sp.]
MDYQLLTSLLPYLEAFQKSEKSDSVIDFIAWLQNAPSVEHTMIPSSSTAISTESKIGIQIMHLVSLSGKYIRFLYKKGFKNSLLQTTEDFGFLASLYHFGDMRKNELIQINTSEFTSGMEVIRRLERNGLIKSSLDKKDRRARRVQLTKEGLKVFLESLPILNNLSEVAVAPLNEADKKRLLELLHQLNDFHNPIFHKEKDSKLEDIINQHVNI